MLIVENGTIIPDANSFVFRSEFISFAATQGVTVADDEQADINLIKAGQFINSLEGKLKGERLERDQAMAYPRKMLVINGFDWADDEIPTPVIHAQMFLALDIRSGIDPYNPEQSLPIIKERVEGAVEVGYASPNVAGARIQQSQATRLIQSLVKHSGLFSIEAIRA
jgi:hypothetical protein